MPFTFPKSFVQKSVGIPRMHFHQKNKMARLPITELFTKIRNSVSLSQNGSSNFKKKEGKKTRKKDRRKAHLPITKWLIQLSGKVNSFLSEMYLSDKVKRHSVAIHWKHYQEKLISVKNVRDHKNQNLGASSGFEWLVSLNEKKVDGPLRFPEKKSAEKFSEFSADFFVVLMDGSDVRRRISPIPNKKIFAFKPFWHVREAERDAASSGSWVRDPALDTSTSGPIKIKVSHYSFISSSSCNTQNLWPGVNPIKLLQVKITGEFYDIFEKANPAKHSFGKIHKNHPLNMSKCLNKFYTF